LHAELERLARALDGERDSLTILKAMMSLSWSNVAIS
jgi:hypothetical protein